MAARRALGAVPLLRPHHDGSEVHVEPGPYAIGDRIAVRVRVPIGSPVNRVAVRTTPDAEPVFHDARPDRVDANQTWWVAEVPIVNPITTYRFAFERGGPTGRSVTWLNGAGVHRHDVPDAADFRVTTHRPPPAWLEGAVGYEVFCDRFARSERWTDRPPEPDWARPAAWSDPVEARGPDAVRQRYGGDLYGLAEHLDHIASVGADVVYLTPFFPARSSHRYDATTFDRVDPLLGGADALATVCAEAHRRGIRVIGDLTLNHTGDHHDWFRAARDDAVAAEAGFYTFHEHPERYACWYGLPHLPELDHRDPELRRRLVDGPDSVVARWMQEPWSLDGWRIDCANTTARRGEFDLNAQIARTTRATMLGVHPDPWLLAEHAYDATVDLSAGGWHGAMAYQWFTRPLAQWLGTMDPLRTMSPRPLGRLDGTTMTEAITSLSAGAPWAALAASMTMLDTHDTPRFRTLVEGDREAHHTALVALFTLPGVPTVFAGSEIGVGGDSMDTARVPFPWDRGSWDHDTLEVVRRLVTLRRRIPALRSGGLRWLPGGPDQVRFAREHPDGTVVVELTRGDTRPSATFEHAEVLFRSEQASVLGLLI